jgi:formylmethanofuran dehydrogenase subunit E
MSLDYLEFDRCLSAAAKVHGDICAGLTIGTRMAIAGLKAIGVEDPKGKDKKNLLVFVEIDRCATDAIMAITGCQPGRRTMKILDYGKMAATFLNLKTGKAVRLTVREKEEDRTEKGASKETGEEPGSLIDLYTSLPDEKLFNMQEVVLIVRPQDMPGKPLSVVKCDMCGERVMDMRERYQHGKTLCRPCAEGTCYYSLHVTQPGK